MRTKPYIFDEYFAAGKEESLSPFLLPSARQVGKNIKLKAAILAAGLLFLAIISQLLAIPHIDQLLLLSVYFLVGTPALIEATHDLLNFEINIDVLMTLAALLSVAIGSPREGALLLVLFEISGALELAVEHKTKGSLFKLREISPKSALLLDSLGNAIESSIDEIQAGQRILIPSSSVVPLDGKVIEGNSFVNLVHLTGESTPQPKHPGDMIPAGCMNLEGTIIIEVLRIQRDSTLQKIISLITEAHENKPRLQKFFDQFGKAYALTIISLTALFCVSFPFLLGIPWLGIEGSIYRSLAFLIAASPCALILAIPTAYLSALSSCAKKGILLKGGMLLDALVQCDVLAFDKTGTLTTGNLLFADLTPLHCTSDPLSNKEILSIAYGLERGANHPIADSINLKARTEKVPPAPIHSYESIPGYGVKGKYKEHDLYLGSGAWVQKLNLFPSEILSLAEREGFLKTFLAIGPDLYVLYFTDEIRPSMKETIETLKKNHLKLLMLTGDLKSNALQIGSALGIDEVHYELKPEQKLDLVINLSRSHKVAMIGDGINDAPSLARAFVGISLGKIGSSTAVEAADIIFLQDDLSLLGWLMKKAQSTKAIVRQNLILALAVILFATTPALLGMIPLWLAVVLHEGGTALVGLNSLRLLRR